MKENEAKDGYDVICGDEKVGEIKNGKDGKDGEKGEDGKSCRVEENQAKDGYDVICGDDVVGELKNGEKGDKGEDGTSCSIEKNEKVNGYEVYCGTEFIGFLTNGSNGKNGEDGKSCHVEKNDDINGYDVFCGDEKVGELRNGKDAVLPSSSSEAQSSSSSEVSSSSSEVPSSSSIEVSSSSIEVSSSSEELSQECQALRATTDIFVSLYDVLGCTRSNEKVGIILRHAARNRNEYGQSNGLNGTGKEQAKQVGEKLKALNLEDFYYMHTNVKRTAETAMIISNNKGEPYSNNIYDWYQITSNNYQNQNNDLLESWYVRPYKSVTGCQQGNNWGWSVYSKFAYEDYNGNTTLQQACEDALYNAKTRTQEFVNKYFAYEQAHKYTLAISHDQFVVPFVIAISDKKIHDTRKNSKGEYYDLRFHAHEKEGEPAMFDYWINYLTGVVIITDGTTIYDETTKTHVEQFTIIPVKALDDAFLHTY